MSLMIEVLTSADPRLVDAQCVLDQSFPDGGHRTSEEAARPWGSVWVASVNHVVDDSNHDADRELAGVLLTWLVADEIHVLSIAVRQEFRARSIGRALLERAFSALRDKGARKVFLEVKRDNAPAIALYRRLGFSVLNTRRAYYADGSDALEMILSWDDLGRVIPLADE
jgi:ribosomal-protein-alanine acetyltransferase